MYRVYYHNQQLHEKKNIYNIEAHERGLAGWPGGICRLASKMSRLRLNVGPAINCHPGVLQAGRGIDVCATLGWTLNGRSVCCSQLVNGGIKKKGG